MCSVSGMVFMCAFLCRESLADKARRPCVRVRRAPFSSRHCYLSFHPFELIFFLSKQVPHSVYSGAGQYGGADGVPAAAAVP